MHSTDSKMITGAGPSWRFGLVDILWLIVLSLAGLAVWLPGLGNRGLWTSGEARAAQVARRMVATGDYITMRQQLGELRLTVAEPQEQNALTYSPTGAARVYDPAWRTQLLQHMSAEYLRTGQLPPKPHMDELITIHKPVLYYWLIALAHQQGMDINNTTVRYFSTVPAVLLLGVTYLLGCVLYERRVGIVAALTLATCMQFWWQVRICQMDMLLSLMMATVFLLWHVGDRSPRPSIRFITFLGIYLLLAAASLLKSFAYMLLAGFVILVFLAVETAVTHPARSWFRAYFGRVLQVTGKMHIFVGLVVYLLLVVPWFVLIHKATDGQFTQGIFLQQMFSRAGLMQVGRAFEHKSEWWFYLVRILADTFPWVIMIPGAIIQVFRPRGRDTWRSGAYLLSWLVVWLVFFSAMAYRKNEYILPLYPAAMILVAKMLVDFVRNQATDKHLRQAIQLAFVGLTIGVVLAGAFVLALMNENFLNWLLTEPLIDGEPIFGNNLNDATALRTIAEFLDNNLAATVGGLLLIMGAMVAATVQILRQRTQAGLTLLTVGMAFAMLIATNVLMDKLIEPRRSQGIFAKRMEPYAEQFAKDKRIVFFATEQHELVYMMPNRFDAVPGVKRFYDGSRRVDQLFALKWRLAGENSPTLVVMEKKIWDLILGQYQYNVRTFGDKDPWIEGLKEIPLDLGDYAKLHRKPLVLLRFDPFKATTTQQTHASGGAPINKPPRRNFQENLVSLPSPSIEITD